MSHRVPVHIHPRGITLALGPVTATIPDGTDDSSTTAATSTVNPSDSSSTSSASKSKNNSKDATTSTASASSSSSSFPVIAAPSSSDNTISATSKSTLSSATSTSTTSQSPAAATTSAGTSPSHSSGTSPGLVAFAVIACLAFVGAIAWILLQRRQHKQREWTFQQHQRIFSRFDKDKADDNRPATAHSTNTYMHPPANAMVVSDGKAWSAGTGATVITTGPSVVRKLDWDQGPDQNPQEVMEKPRRKPVPPPKEKKKTFSQYLPYLLPQHHSAEVIELGKAQQQVYQKPIYKPAS